MASLQKAVISFLLILSVAFVFFAQATEATKGPKITHKVRGGFRVLEDADVWLTLWLGVLRYYTRR